MAFGTFKYRLRKWVFWIGFGLAALVLLTAFVLDRRFGKDVQLIVPYDSSIVELNRGLYTEGDPIAEIYGVVLSHEPIRIVLPSRDRLIKPKEDPSLALLSVDKQKGENPLQATTVWFFTKYSVPPLVFLGLVGFLLPRKPRRGEIK